MEIRERGMGSEQKSADAVCRRDHWASCSSRQQVRVVVLSHSKLVKSDANAICLTLLAPSCA